MLTDYQGFLDSKTRTWSGCGLRSELSGLRDHLYPFQAALTKWALQKGRAAIFADTGLGKTRMQLSWANEIPGRVLIVCPLCVSGQTIREGATIGVGVSPHRSDGGIEIINYERLHHVDPNQYQGIVLDESSILKSFDGKTRTRLIEMFKETAYKLCCTATPAPNDSAELANHCEFLGIMTRAEMLATFFVHDENGWRLKGHAEKAFYKWLASWGMFMRLPSDLGFNDDGYLLPSLSITETVVKTGHLGSGEFLFPGMGLGGIRGRITARRVSIDERVAEAIRLVEASSDPWIIWCGLNDEQAAISKSLDGQSVSVQGSDDEDDKKDRLSSFIHGSSRVLITKPKIAGFGLNLQHCHNMIFLGIGDSYESYYQCIRRCYRFGQKHPVNVVIIVSESETEIVRNVRRKEVEAADVAQKLIASVRELEKEEIGMTQRETEAYKTESANGERWELYRGDSIEIMKGFPENSVDLSIYSPPFISLYTYSNTERDIGNCSTREEFLQHFGYAVNELLRITKPGRLTCCHIGQVPSQKARDGEIGLFDLRGPVIHLFVDRGWVYHGDITIDKDPQAQAIRTHSKGLLFVQLKKDSSWLRPALADYILVFRKKGENQVAIHPDLTNDEWIEWARPIWYGIRESDTLNVREARANDDDRHICPLQLGTIERCVRLWSNLGELVFSPFAGIGSEGYEAIRLGRKFLGVELKQEYFNAARKNLDRAENQVLAQKSLF